MASTTPPPPFRPVRSELDFPRDEAATLAEWKERGIFDKALAASTRRTGPSKGTYVFYEGPPTANGMPHNGHVLTRAMKDLYPRFFTMRGWDVPRKAGWDTHGLPVEVEVEKELRIHGKAGIEAYGVEPFAERCIESVFRYTDAWEKLTDKIGFWVDLKEAYVTYHREYVESVWWALATLFDKGLLYQGHKVVWWWAQGGTALSSGEVGLGYKTVDDPSVFVAFPLRGAPDSDLEGASLLVWTTTPWTLSSNMYAAVHAEFEYAIAQDGEKKLVLAAELVPAVSKKLGRELRVLATKKGSELVGLSYSPPFDTFASEPHPAVHRVIAASFVALDASGIVHVAPAFGEDDFGAHKEQLKHHPDAPLYCAVAPDGTFVPAMGKYAGRWVKDCDKELSKELAERGLLVHAEVYRHEYPFCWRSDGDALIQYARPAWYVRTTERIGEAIANNRAVHWLPDHIREGRFGDFLRNNVDWALSRERYWGTPLPIWVNDALPEGDPKRFVAIRGLDDLRARKASNLAAVEAELAAAVPDAGRARHLLVHKPWIDRVTFEEEGVAGTYRRVGEVIDCWFDSGCMPFAQWGFPHAPGSVEAFDRAFPADFISEAIDQTRGWFYSLLMVSTLLFDEPTLAAHGLAARPHPHPYKTCVVLGHVCDREGKKESKSKGNYTPPEIILERVRMEFAAFDGQAHGLKEAADGREGVAYVAREDYEGLDLQGESARVVVYRDGRASEGLSLELRPAKLRRRVVALAKADLARLGLTPSDKALTTPPNDVPRMPSHEKVWVEDPNTPAPGADAFRWFFYASSPPWTNTRHSLGNVRLAQKDFVVRLRNVYSFFVIYANVDGFSPASLAAEPARPRADRPLLDRWILSELALATREVTRELERYHSYEAAQALVSFVDALSNWYVRRSRDRFWSDVASPTAAVRADKRDAYATLYTVLHTLARLCAPFVPFFADELWQNVARGPWATEDLAQSEAESVHLAAWPETDEAAIDEALALEMAAVREAVSLGLQVRTVAKLKVRQPLSRADVVVSRPELRERLAVHAALVAEELNVHEARFVLPGQEGGAVRYTLKPNFKALGPKLGKRVQAMKEVLAKADAGALRAALAESGRAAVEVAGETVWLEAADVEVAVSAEEGFAAAGGKVGVVVLHAALTDALRDEGYARELVSRVQSLRKELELGFTERVELFVAGGERVARVVRAHGDGIATQVLASSLSSCDELPTDCQLERLVDIEGDEVRLGVKRA